MSHEQTPKTIATIATEPQNVRFDEIDMLLVGLGFEKRQRGSHVTYVSPEYGRITIPIKKPFILPVYVKEVLALLEEGGAI